MTQNSERSQHLPIIDSLIASTAQAKSFVLLTKNEKDFKNLDIKVINPFKVEYIKIIGFGRTSYMVYVPKLELWDEGK